jgi:hypothetical protein
MGSENEKGEVRNRETLRLNCGRTPTGGASARSHTDYQLRGLQPITESVSKWQRHRRLGLTNS